MLIGKGQDRSGHRYLFLESVVSLKYVSMAEKKKDGTGWMDAIIQISRNWAQMNSYGILGSGLSYLAIKSLTFQFPFLGLSSPYDFL